MSDNIFEQCVAVHERGGPAWHRKGQVMTDEPSPTEALVRIDGDFEVVKVPVTATVDGISIPLNDGYHVIRKPAGSQDAYVDLGSCGADYEPLQNRQITDMLADLAQHWPVETIGILGVGEAMFVTLAAGDLDVGGDQVKRYFLVTDNKTPKLGGLTIKDVRTRVVCQNTLDMALGEKGNQIDLRHTAGLGDRAALAVELYNRLREQSAAVDEAILLMARAKLPKDGAVKILGKVFPDPKKNGLVEMAYSGQVSLDSLPEAQAKVLRGKRMEYEAEIGRMKTYRVGAVQLYDRLCDEFPKIGGTPWAVAQAVAELVDWGPTRTADRAQRAMYGEGSVFKRRAVAAALDVARKAKA